MSDPAEHPIRLREFHADWDTRLASYLTISRDEEGTWNYFFVKPKMAERVYEDGVEQCSTAGAIMKPDSRRAKSWRWMR